MSTPQELGYQWDAEVARLIGGERHPGSGNRVYRKLDASVGTLIFSGKHTVHRSFSVTDDDLDEAVRAVSGPEGLKPGVVPILAVKLGTGRKVAVLDLETLVEWLQAPPQIIEPSKQDALRATARTPPFLR